MYFEIHKIVYIVYEYIICRKAQIQTGKLHISFQKLEEGGMRDRKREGSEGAAAPSVKLDFLISERPLHLQDLFNDLFACAFLVGAVVFAVRSRRSMHLHYLLAVILIGVAGVFALIDMCLQRNNFRGKRAKKHKLISPPGKEKEPQQGKGPEPAKPPEPAKGKK